MKPNLKKKKNNKQIIKLWLKLSKNGQDLPSTSWLCSKMKCSDSHIDPLQHYHWWGTSKRNMLPATCQCATGLKNGRCKRACPIYIYIYIYLLDLKLQLVVLKSCLHGFRWNCHKNTRTTQYPNMWKDREQLVKRPWKTREKAVKNFDMWINLVWAFWSGIPCFHLWVCNHIDVHVVHLNLFRSSVDSGSGSFFFSQRFNFLIAPNWSRNGPC